nr:hypothetical protein [Neisseria dumasiana]
MPDRTSAGAAKFPMCDVVDCCHYTIESVYSDDGMEYKGCANHPFSVRCYKNYIGQLLPVSLPANQQQAEGDTHADGDLA